MKGSLTMPWSFSTLCIAASSTAAPTTAALRAGPAWSTGVNAIDRPPPAASADPVNTNGSWFPGSCQDGVAVLASSTAV